MLRDRSLAELAWLGAVPLSRPRLARVHLVPVRRARLLPARRLRRVETRAPRRRQKLPPMDALIRLDRQNTLPSLSPHPVAGRSLAQLLIAMHLHSTALLLTLPLLRCLVTPSRKCLKRLRNKFLRLLNRPLPRRHLRRFHAPLLHPMRTLCDSAGEMSLSVWQRTAGLCGACCLKTGNWVPLTEISWSSSFPAKGWSQALQTGDAHRSWRTRSMTSWVFVCTSVHRWDNPAVGRQCQRLLPMRIPLRLLYRAHQCRPQLLRPHLLKNRSPLGWATQTLRRTKQHQHRISMFRRNRSMPRNPMIRRHQNLTIGILRRRPLLIRGIRLKR